MDSNRPRLLVLASTFPRWKGDTEPRFVEALCHELAEPFQVFVLAPHCKGALRQETSTSKGRSIEVRRFRYGPDALQTLAYDGGMLFRIRSNPLRVFLLPVFFLAQAVAAVRLHRAIGFDAVHAHWIVPQGFVAAILSVFMRRFPPLMVTSHGGDLNALRGPLLERLKRWILGRADAVTVVSHAMRDYCEERGLAPEKTIVQSMGVDLEALFTPGDTANVRDGLVFVGRLVEKKGVEYLLEAMAILAPDYPLLKLTIVGDGPLRASLAALAHQRGVSERVRFVGSVRNEEVPAYLRSAAIFIMPSEQEGLGLVAVEAQGCGCAVVASDLPTVRDVVIDGQTGLMARPADAADLADKIAALLDDDALRRTLTNSGRNHALENFNWTSVGSVYTRIIRDLIADSS